MRHDDAKTQWQNPVALVRRLPENTDLLPQKIVGLVMQIWPDILVLMTLLSALSINRFSELTTDQIFYPYVFMLFFGTFTGLSLFVIRGAYALGEYKTWQFYLLMLGIPWLFGLACLQFAAIAELDALSVRLIIVGALVATAQIYLMHLTATPLQIELANATMVFKGSLTFLTVFVVTSIADALDFALTMPTALMVIFTVIVFEIYWWYYTAFTKGKHPHAVLTGQDRNWINKV